MVFVDWQCVYDDGARPFAPDVPIDQRRPLAITIGEDTTIRIDLVSPTGSIAHVAGSGWLELALRSGNAVAANVILVRKSTVRSGGYQIVIAAKDLIGYTPQRGTFDLWAVEGAARRVVVPRSELSIGGVR